MKRFLFAYIDFFENDNKIIEIEAEDGLSAARKLAERDGYQLPKICSIEDIKDLFFQGDIGISDPYEIKCQCKK